jgi:hypothetical protein
VQLEGFITFQIRTFLCLARKKVPQDGILARKVLKTEMSLYFRITYFCHILSSYKHFNKNDDMYVNFFPALTARIRVKMHLCNMDEIDYL